MHSLAITINCGGQCTVASSFQAHQCEDLVNELGIPQCNQAECSPRLYNLSACTNAENEVNITDTTIQNSVIDSTAEQSQANTPTRMMEQSQESSTATVLITETMKEPPLDNCNTNQQLTAVAPLAITIVILIVLLVIVSVTLIWTCWILKTKGTRKSQNQYR